MLFVKRPFSKIPWAAGATDTEQPHKLSRQKHLPPLNPDIKLLSTTQVLLEINVQGFSMAVPSPAT